MLDLKSATTDQVTEMWLIGFALLLSYASKYLFMQNVENSTNTTLLSDLELSCRTFTEEKWLGIFDGLDLRTTRIL
jgi:hypothetical protein